MSETTPSPIIERIAKLCELGDINGRELDRLAGLASGHVWMLRKRNKAASLDTLTAIAKATGCTVGWLSNGEGETPTKEQVTAALCAKSSAIIQAADEHATDPAPSSAAE